jgi:predicted ATPase
MKGIGFKNMKVFKEEQWFDFKDITLLTGTNNSGKSSIINAMQMLQENINAKNIDELLRTEFKLTSNQTKYGSIANFVNNKSTKPEDNYFVYIRKIENIEYRIKIDINSGLESYGSIHMISALDVKSKDDIFTLRVENPYPNYECSFRINYKYFIDKFNTKCRNTEILRKRIIELDKLCKGVNEGVNSVEDFKKLADAVSKEVSVYIYSDKITWGSVDTNEETESFKYFIREKKDEFMEDNAQSINEIEVIFMEDKKDENGFKFNPSFINEVDYNKSFKNTYENGIFDFSLLWEKNPEIENEFSNLICNFYKKDFKKSYKMLSEDLITLLSNSNWNMKEIYSEEFGNSAVPTNLTKAFIDSFPDFGLTGALLQRKETNKKGRSAFNSNQFLEANHAFNEKSEAMINLRKTNFIEEVYYDLSRLFLKCYETNKNKIYLNKLIFEPVFNKIQSDIIKKIVNINVGLYNTTYVSSNRFTTKRAYSFNDNSDFTNILKQVETSPEKQREISKKFINKWIKEFGIGDELVLKSDEDTGNFKASLRKEKVETPLADFGLGTNQLLPIIFSLSVHRYGYINSVYDEELIPRTLVIEEPESNLHPAMQSKLADMFVEATNKFKVQIIAETHSEYLIRKMQYLVAKEYLYISKDGISISNDRVNIYYVNSDKDAEGRKAYEINITKNGQLTESFGKGFFDETTNLQFELYKLNNVQFN